MSEEAVAVSATPDKGQKKKMKTAVKKPKMSPSHPKVSEMVVAAIGSLKERGGSSLQAIKKHIASQHKVDMDRLTPFIKKYLKSAVANGTLVQTKGKGATGSFKMGTNSGKAGDAKKKTVKKSSAEKVRTPKKPKTVPKVAKKVSKPKAERKKPAGVKKSALGAKKSIKTPKKVAKPKSPKVKTMKKVAPKKTAKKK